MSIQVIQGGMGVGISGWRLARAVASRGELGVVSATALGTVMARQLQDGDPDGHLRRALAACPLEAAAERVLERWYRAGGRAGDPYRQVPMFTVTPTRSLEELNIVANFAEVWLAKDGHDGPVGINHLTKILLPVPSGLYGAMLAGVDFVIMGAGIPSHIPHVLDQLARGEAVNLAVDVAGAGDPVTLHFDPARHDSPLHDGSVRQLSRPQFVAIVASVALATFLVRDEATCPDGLIVEAPCAGGHNAPPRGAMQLDDTGQPVYGPRDDVNAEALKKLGVPFWLAGGEAEAGSVERAIGRGAQGVQIGTAFAYCDESGLAPSLKQAAITRALGGTVKVFTDPSASPSGYPFKVVELGGTLSEEQLYQSRERVCDVGMLRTVTRRPDGVLAYRCPSEPVDDYVRKGGDIADTVGRKCLCNALLADVELGQLRGDAVELPLVTAGDDIRNLTRYVDQEHPSYSAADVIDHVLAPA